MLRLGQNKPVGHVVCAWLVLMALTAATWWLGAERAIAPLGVHLVMAGILVLTFGKIAVVGHSFMELREAAPWLQRTFFGWCVATCVVLTVMSVTM